MGRSLEQSNSDNSSFISIMSQIEEKQKRKENSKMLSEDVDSFRIKYENGLIQYQLVKDFNRILQEENKRLREALMFYAEEYKYEDNISTTYGYTCEISYDEGKKAREALAK